VGAQRPTPGETALLKNRPEGCQPGFAIGVRLAKRRLSRRKRFFNG
jgi:hypothetical protein